MSSGLLEGIVSSGKASISVILVLVYGYVLRKLNFISQEGESVRVNCILELTYKTVDRTSADWVPNSFCRPCSFQKSDHWRPRIISETVSCIDISN
jgi:hypothetical protein